MTQNNSPKANGWRSVGQVYTWSNAERSCWTQMLHICLLIRLILHGLTMTLIYPTQTGTVPRQVVTSDPVLYAPIPRDVSTSCYRLASSFGSLTPSSECTSVYPLGALGGGGKQQPEWWSAIWTHWASPQRALYLLKRVAEATVDEPQSHMKPEVRRGLCTSVTAFAMKM